MQSHCSVQMQRRNGVVVDINATCTELGPKCLQLMGMHVLSGCNIVSYPFNKCKISALNIIQAGDFPGLYQVLGEEDATHSDLMETGQRFFAALYGQPLGTTTSEARYRIYSRKTGKPIRIMALPPTEVNLYLHVCRAHLQITLWEAADQQGPPKVDITQFGWDVKGGTRMETNKQSTNLSSSLFRDSGVSFVAHSKRALTLLANWQYHAYFQQY